MCISQKNLSICLLQRSTTAITAGAGTKTSASHCTTHLAFFSLNPLALKFRRDSSAVDNVSISLHWYNIRCFSSQYLSHLENPLWFPRLVYWIEHFTCQHSSSCLESSNPPTPLLAPSLNSRTKTLFSIPCARIHTKFYLIKHW